VFPRLTALPIFLGPSYRLCFGGLDFGWSAPTAAFWAFIDPTGPTLVLAGELYQPELTLPELAAALPRQPVWFADPSNPAAIHDLRHAGFRVNAADNTLSVGIESVNRLLKTNRLAACPGVVPHLLAEAATAVFREEHITGPDHALDALRYLVRGALAHHPALRP